MNKTKIKILSVMPVALILPKDSQEYLTSLIGSDADLMALGMIVDKNNTLIDESYLKYDLIS